MNTIFYRQAQIQQRAASTQEDGHYEIEVICSTETPVRLWGKNREILQHGAENIALDFFSSGKAPAQRAHDRRDVVGVVTKATLENRQLKANIRLSRTEGVSDLIQDIRDGIMNNVSIGYAINRYDRVQREDGGTDYRITHWEPAEISFVGVPADRNAMIQKRDFFNCKERNMPEQISEPETVTPDLTPTGQRNHNNPHPESGLNAPEGLTGQRQAISTPSGFNIDHERELLRQQERTRIDGIRQMGQDCQMIDLAEEAIFKGESIDAFRQRAFEELKKRQAPISGTSNIDTIQPYPRSGQDSLGSQIGLQERDYHNYSLLRVAHSLMSGQRDRAGFEWEIADNLRKRSGRDSEGFLIPAEVLTRDLNVTTPADGGHLVPTVHRADLFIESLRNQAQVGKLGAKMMSGLVGNIEIPRLLTTPVASWKAEGAAADEGSMSFDQVTMRPKSIRTFVDYSKKLLMQSAPSVEQIIREELIAAVVLGVDKAALLGSGSGDEPEGIINATGVNTVTIAAGAPTYADMVDMVNAIEIANIRPEELGFLMNARDKGILQKTLESATAGARYIWRNGTPMEGQVASQRALWSNQLGNDQMIFGAWNNLMIGFWSAIELTLDPITQKLNNIVRMYVDQEADLAIRRPAAFSKTVTL